MADSTQQNRPISLLNGSTETTQRTDAERPPASNCTYSCTRTILTLVIKLQRQMRGGSHSSMTPSETGMLQCHEKENQANEAAGSTCQHTSGALCARPGLLACGSRVARRQVSSTAEQRPRHAPAGSIVRKLWVLLL